MISIVIPTVPGREEHLERCLTAYAELTVGEFELLVQPGHDCCGKAWNAGAQEATGEFLHLTADDLAPRERGWNVHAEDALELGKIPAPVIWRPEGRVESIGGHWQRPVAAPTCVPERVWTDWDVTTNTCVVPFCRLADWRANLGPVIETHYYTDNWYTDQCRRAGLEVILRVPYSFDHHWASEGRGAGMTERDRLVHDRAIYEQATAALEEEMQR